MKQKKERIDDEDETKEITLPSSKSQTENNIEKPMREEEFKVTGKQAKEMDNGVKQKKEDKSAKAITGDQPENDASEQDALFEVSDSSKGSACDDEDVDLSSEKGVEEKSADKKKEELSPDTKKIEELSEQLKAANDKYLRLMAEFDNFKRRSAKEYERMMEMANEKLIKDITEVRENFERAFKSNAEGEKFLEGMKLIFSKFNTILQKHGLEVYTEVGQKFDPELHDALMRTPHEKIDEGHIVEVHERGYKLKGNIIKHAKVIVSSGKPQKKVTESEAVIEIK